MLLLPSARALRYDSPAISSETTIRTPLSILLVEDHADTLDVLAGLLRADGHAVDAAGTVGEALRLCAGRRHDLLIADIGLPDGTGVDLMREIRKLHDVPGVALTGFAESHYVDACAAAGFAAHLVKPVAYKDLTQAIAELVTRNCLALPAHTLQLSAGAAAE